MARKKLNKKVAIIGALALVFVAVCGIAVILRFSQDADKFIKDGDVALGAARQAVDEEIKKEEYAKAIRNYGRASGRSKSDSKRVEILFKLAGVFHETEQWNKVLACWDNISRLDDENIESRLGKLNYFYVMADTGLNSVWREIETLSSELIEIVEKQELFEGDLSQWEKIEVVKRDGSDNRIGPYLHLLRGRAVLVIANMGAVIDKEEALERAIGDLEKVKETDSDNVDAYWYLAQAIISKGELLASRGSLEQREESEKQAEDILKNALEVVGEQPQAYINLMAIKFVIAERADTSPTREGLQALEGEYLELADKFSSEAKVFSALSDYYRRLGHKYLDKAIEAIEKARDLDNENVTYAIAAANLRYQKFFMSLTTDKPQKGQLEASVKIAQDALGYPDAQDVTGPRNNANRTNRLLLYTFLTNSYIEQVLEHNRSGATDGDEVKQLLADAEQMVHQIEQLYGSGENPQVIKWRGMLELAQGKDREVSIRKMYAAYEQIESTGDRDAVLSYCLAEEFKESGETGAVKQFLESAIYGGITLRRPEIYLDYADVMYDLRAFNPALNVVNGFEAMYWSNERSRDLRTRLYIAANQFDQAEEELAKLRAERPEDPNVIKLDLELVKAKSTQVGRSIAQREGRGLDLLAEQEEQTLLSEGEEELLTAELENYRQARARLTKKLLELKPDFVEENDIAIVCSNYIRQGEIEQAQSLVDQFLAHFPDNMRGLYIKQRILEGESANVSEQRRKEMELAAISDMADPVQKTLSFGLFYQRNDEPNEAIAEFEKMLETEATGETKAGKEMINEARNIAARYLFELLIQKENWGRVQEIIELARTQNFDGCEGNFFAARLAEVKGENKQALLRLDECLRQRPVFSHAYMLRSNVYAALENEPKSIDDARKAVTLNPLDGAIAKGWAITLIRRNEKLGDNITTEQTNETKEATLRAVALNRGDWELQSFYAEYISDTEPQNALAIRQRLQRFAPSVGNAILWGRMAMRIAEREYDSERKQAFFDIAGEAFKQASEIDPANEAVIESYGEYYRLTGQGEKAQELLTQSQDKRLLFNHHFRSGRFNEARAVMLEAYDANSKDTLAIRGLLLVGERTFDQESVKKYSEELLQLEDSLENRLIQAQGFINLGLIKEAEPKIQSLKEKYPDEPRALLLEAWLAMKQGRLEDALKLVNRNLEIDRENALAWRIRGEANFFLGKYDEAISDLTRSKSIANVPVTRISLAKAYIQAGREEDAITELKNTIEMPQAPEEARMLLEGVYLKLGRKETLVSFYNEVLEQYPDSVSWLNRAGLFAIENGYLGRGGAFYEAAWTKSLEQGKGDATAFDGLLRALLLSNKLDQFFAITGKYVDSEFASIALYRMAEARKGLGDKEVAVEHCRRAIDKSEDNYALAYDILSKMKSLLGEEEVLNYCQEKLQANPNSIAANLTMFNVAKLNGEYNKALNYVNKVLELMTDDNPDKLAFLLERAMILQLAYMKTSDGEYLQRVIAEYESLLEKMPNNADILNNLAYVLAENDQKLGDALKYIKRACEIRSNNPGLLDTYGYVLYKNDKFLEADESLQASVQQYELRRMNIPADVYEHIGMVKEKLDSLTQAIAAYRQALEVGTGTLSDVSRERIESAIARAEANNKY